MSQIAFLTLRATNIRPSWPALGKSDRSSFWKKEIKNVLMQTFLLINISVTSLRAGLNLWGVHVLLQQTLPQQITLLAKLVFTGVQLNEIINNQSLLGDLLSNALRSFVAFRQPAFRNTANHPLDCRLLVHYYGRTIQDLLHYLDDFIMAAPANSGLCLQSSSSCLGVPLSLKVTRGRLPWLPPLCAFCLHSLAHCLTS